MQHWQKVSREISSRAMFSLVLSFFLFTNNSGMKWKIHILFQIMRSTELGGKGEQFETDSYRKAI